MVVGVGAVVDTSIGRVVGGAVVTAGADVVGTVTDASPILVAVVEGAGGLTTEVRTVDVVVGAESKAGSVERVGGYATIGVALGAVVAAAVTSGAVDGVAIVVVAAVVMVVVAITVASRTMTVVVDVLVDDSMDDDGTGAVAVAGRDLDGNAAHTKAVMTMGAITAG
jgi:hypothetical protein